MKEIEVWIEVADECGQEETSFKDGWNDNLNLEQILDVIVRAYDNIDE